MPRELPRHFHFLDVTALRKVGDGDVVHAVEPPEEPAALCEQAGDELIVGDVETAELGDFQLSRERRGGEALMTIEIDGGVPEELMDRLRALPEVQQAILIPAL